MCEPYNRKRALRNRKNQTEVSINKKLKLSSSELSKDTRLSHSFSSEPSQSLRRKLVEEYEREHSQFIESGLSQKSLLLIRRIVHSPLISSDFRGQPLFKLLMDIYQKLALNEIEITV